MLRRPFLLVIVLVAYTAIIAQVGWLACALILGEGDWPLSGPDWDEVFLPFTRSEGRTAILLPAAVFTVLQVLFLLPIVRPELVRHNHKRALLVSVIASGIVGGMLATGLFAALIEGYGILFNLNNPLDKIFEPIANEHFIWWPVVLIAWCLWTPILIVFARRQPSNRLHARLVGMLFAGTAIELLVVVPLDIMVRRRTSCYCGTGTAIGLCLAVCATLWLTGPGIIIAATSRRRRWWYENHCETCGYEKGPSPSPKCPECGFDWVSPAAKTATG